MSCLGRTFLIVTDRSTVPYSGEDQEVLYANSKFLHYILHYKEQNHENSHNHQIVGDDFRCLPNMLVWIIIFCQVFLCDEKKKPYTRTFSLNKIFIFCVKILLCFLLYVRAQ